MRIASIERTAYPRLNRHPTAQELADVYTPTALEAAFARATARGPAPTLTLLVLLKVFQRLGYFPRLQDVPFQCWRTSDRASDFRDTETVGPVRAQRAPLPPRDGLGEGDRKVDQSPSPALPPHEIFDFAGIPGAGHLPREGGGTRA